MASIAGRTFSTYLYTYAQASTCVFDNFSWKTASKLKKIGSAGSLDSPKFLCSHSWETSYMQCGSFVWLCCNFAWKLIELTEIPSLISIHWSISLTNAKLGLWSVLYVLSLWEITLLWLAYLSTAIYWKVPINMLQKLIGNYLSLRKLSSMEGIRMISEYRVMIHDFSNYNILLA